MLLISFCLAVFAVALTVASHVLSERRSARDAAAWDRRCAELDRRRLAAGHDKGGR